MSEIIDDRDSAIKYRGHWKKVDAPTAPVYQGTLTSCNSDDSSNKDVAILTFTGVKVSVVVSENPIPSGVIPPAASYSVDDSPSLVVSGTSAEENTKATIWESGQLQPGQHQLTISVISCDSTAPYLLDYFQVDPGPSSVLSSTPSTTTSAPSSQSTPSSITDSTAVTPVGKVASQTNTLILASTLPTVTKTFLSATFPSSRSILATVSPSSHNGVSTSVSSIIPNTDNGSTAISQTEANNQSQHAGAVNSIDPSTTTTTTTTTSSSSSSSSSSQHSVPIGAVVGGAIGGVLLLILLGVAAYIRHRRMRLKAVAEGAPRLSVQVLDGDDNNKDFDDMSQRNDSATPDPEPFLRPMSGASLARSQNVESPSSSTTRLLLDPVSPSSPILDITALTGSELDLSETVSNSAGNDNPDNQCLIPSEKSNPAADILFHASNNLSAELSATIPYSISAGRALPQPPLENDTSSRPPSFDFLATDPMQSVTNTNSENSDARQGHRVTDTSSSIAYTEPPPAYSV
ncbi:hypothetical protein C8Q75DRAFT_218733 [Abortiporus biennis]|nr:hypothetical protein C8Q75DRAFT_218733 [Abortiporus biennis]